MATVDSVLRSEHALEALHRQGARLAATAAYLGAVVTAYLLLAPVLPNARSAEVTLPAAEPVATYSIQQGDTLALIAAQNGVSVTRLLAFNPGLDPFALEPKATVRIG